MMSGVARMHIPSGDVRLRHKHIRKWSVIILGRFLRLDAWRYVIAIVDHPSGTGAVIRLPRPRDRERLIVVITNAYYLMPASSTESGVLA